MKKYRGSIIAQQIIDDREREERERKRVLKELYRLYKKKRGESCGRERKTKSI